MIIFKMNILRNLSLYLLPNLLVVALFTNQVKAAEHNLTFAVSGVVASVKVKIGDQVKAGTVLAVLDLTPFKAARRSTEAASNFAKLILAFSKRRLKHAQELFDALSISGEELEKAKIEYAKALSGYQDAKSEAEIATWRLQHATLKAPFNGKISAVPGYPGTVIKNTVGNQYVVTVDRK
jgi:RND family efflux transporter MFP subunit